MAAGARTSSAAPLSGRSGTADDATTRRGARLLAGLATDFSAWVRRALRYHLLAFLAGVRTARGGASSGGSMTDSEMVHWANDKAREGRESTGAAMRDFSDKTLSSGLFLIDLLAAVEPRCIDRSLVTAGGTDEEKKLNAKYVISSARKINCSLFLLWEDIVDVKPKMILSFVATVMSHAMHM